MTEGQTTLLISALLGMLGFLLAALGQRIFSKLDDLQQSLNNGMLSMQKSISDGDNAIHERVTQIDRRVTRIEATCSVEHPMIAIKS